ncbi:hypothetical protein PRK78_002273 [Emydomyces testavorans]|uniref:Uncharacterized protein n=1 Tax=Emydomyces testavorans TaxID=2070801 RepID=A0AAF0IHG0_9EURO|nr:hypothetical protein PRK78_002273 [Emydomyces testavorans]
MDSHKGTKTTSDPSRYTNPIREGAGFVAADSLAAESVRSGGKFAENKDSAPLSVEGHKSTLANKDTSGATALPPARDAEQRLPDEEHISRPSREQDAASASKSASAHASGSARAPATSTTGGHADIAPSYVEGVLGKGNQKPKGKNLKEGGFDDDPHKNASFTTDIGSREDPGYLAERRFESENAENPQEAALGTGGRVDTGASRKGEQPYGALQPEQEA